MLPALLLSLLASSAASLHTPSWSVKKPSCYGASSASKDPYVPGVPYAQIAATLPAAYFTPPETLFQQFSDLAERFPSRVKLINLNVMLGTERTLEGRDLFAVKISDNVELDEPEEPNILLVSNHHARELMTPEITLNATRRLVLEYSTDSEIRDIVDRNQIYVMWTMNPDGLHYVWTTDNWWRKNRRRNSDSTYGVDLNRNYPVGWNFTCSGSTKGSSEEFRGEAPASEAETKTMLAFHDKMVFSKVIDIHSYSEEVRSIYGSCASLPSEIDSLFMDIASQAASKSDYSPVHSCCLAGNIHSAYARHGSLSFLIETGKSFQPDTAKEVYETVERVWPSIKYFFALTGEVHGVVRDRTTGQPVEADIIVPDFASKFTLGERVHSEKTTGRFHLWIPTGRYEVILRAKGYEDELVVVESRVGAAGSPRLPTLSVKMTRHLRSIE